MTSFNLHFVDTGEKRVVFLRHVSHFYFSTNYWFISFAPFFILSAFQNFAKVINTTIPCIIVLFIISPRLMGISYGV